MWTKLLQPLIPTQFYYVREEITPKASFNALKMMTTFIYMICLLCFILIFIQESNRSFHESKIVDEDLTDDHWKCEMISKVTSEYAIDEYEKVYLVNTMQSKGECSSTLDSLAPCGNGLALINGSTTTTIMNGVGTVDIVATSKYLFLLDNGKKLDRLEHATGKVGTVVTNTEPSTQQNLAVDGQEKVYLYYTFSGTNPYADFYVYDPITNTSQKILTFPYPSGWYISDFDVNDAGDHLYLLVVKGTSYVSPTTFWSKINNTAYDCLIPNNGCQEVFQYDGYSTSKSLSPFTALVYSTTANSLYFSNRSNTIYSYSLNGSPNVGIRTHYIDPVSTIGFASLDIDSEMNLYAHALQSSPAFDYLYKISSDGVKTLLLAVECSRCLDGITKHPTENYLYSQYHDPDTLVYTTLRASSIQANQKLNLLRSYSGVIGWFTCGDLLQSPVNEVNSNICPLNGALWKFYDDALVGYFFSDNQYEAYAIPLVQPSCTASDYNYLCVDIVGHLPPYSCTRTIHNSVLNSLSISLANTQALLALLIIVGGFVLQKFSEYKFANSDRKDSAVAFELGGKGSASTTTNNPISFSETSGMVSKQEHQDLLQRFEQLELRLRNLEQMKHDP